MEEAERDRLAMLEVQGDDPNAVDQRVELIRKELCWANQLHTSAVPRYVKTSS